MEKLQEDVTDIHLNNIRVFISLLNAFQKFKILRCVEDLVSYSYRNIIHIDTRACGYVKKQILLQTQEDFSASVMKEC